MRQTVGCTATAFLLALGGCSSSSGGGGDSGGSTGAGGGGGSSSSAGLSLSAAGGSSSQGGSSATPSSVGGEKGTAGSISSGGNPQAGSSASSSKSTGGQGGGTGGKTATTSAGGTTGTGGSAGGIGGSSNQGGTTGGTSGTAGNKGGSATASTTGTGGSTGTGGTTGTGGSTGPVRHRFLKSGHSSQSVAIVAADGTIEWELKIGDETADSWLLPNGNVIFSFVKGVREVKPDKTTVWEYTTTQSGVEVQSCQPLADDKFLIGEAHSDGTSFLYEMGRDKTITKKITIKTSTTNAHDEFRQVRKTPKGTYLVTQQRGGGKAQEYDADGNLLRTFPCGRYVAVRLPDENTLIACGDDHRVIEVDASNNIVWEVKENDIPGNKLLFAAGVHRLANGNTVIANWSGHAGDPTQPQVFEITRDKKVVWEAKDAKLNLISSIQILDSDALVNGASLR